MLSETMLACSAFSALAADIIEGFEDTELAFVLTGALTERTGFGDGSPFCLAIAGFVVRLPFVSRTLDFAIFRLRTFPRREVVVDDASVLMASISGSFSRGLGCPFRLAAVFGTLEDPDGDSKSVTFTSSSRGKSARNSMVKGNG